MPFIAVKTAKATTEQKAKLIADITRVASEDLGMPPQAFFVLVEENEPENWGVGGKTLPQIAAEKNK
ncbi:MAG: 4-oxalocrotonate tautomerase family protein [Selenomonas sp.]|jgi:4-oxalocrotonate tautomerase|uniref:4-oxalocrotonate tautomerase DmpI n=1 Tax=Selenomonas sp. KH1T6 TaxID=3158784 RepID=UPI0008A77B51|nr:4-oxalocrotonate tautomerase family protein [Selenomonas ruminantium]MBO6291318.1 4-oxalocrotonate tautomerase family protein [Selenomonas sp.]MBQ7498558.1 4-oxalocrotonate tautomerase family protein [Selenomonas sp.]SEH21362.1 4-oxalocrotonate tautomerase [Selenomonas ruminantium]